AAKEILDMTEVKHPCTLKDCLFTPWRSFWQGVRNTPRADKLRAGRSVLFTAVVLLALYGVLWGITHWSARGTANSALDEAWVLADAQATNLIVVVHQYTGSSNTMSDVRDAIKAVRPNSDILMVQYPASIFSNGDCPQIAESLCQKIHRAWSTGR